MIVLDIIGPLEKPRHKYLRAVPLSVGIKYFYGIIFISKLSFLH